MYISSSIPSPQLLILSSQNSFLDSVIIQVHVIKLTILKTFWQVFKYFPNALIALIKTKTNNRFMKEFGIILLLFCVVIW